MLKSCMAVEVSFFYFIYAVTTNVNNSSKFLINSVNIKNSAAKYAYQKDIEHEL